MVGGLSLLAACAHDQPYKEVPKPFPVSRVIGELGNDYRQTELDGDRTRYTWSWTRSTLMQSQPPPSTPFQASAPAVQAVTVSCTVNVIADANGQVTATQTVGSGCARILGTDFWLE